MMVHIKIDTGMEGSFMRKTPPFDRQSKEAGCHLVEGLMTFFFLREEDEYGLNQVKALKRL
jgi:hypothetical protein